MHWLISAMIGVLLGLAPPAQAAQKTLEGSWTATAAEREGKADADVVGHRLSVAGKDFEDSVQGRHASLRRTPRNRSAGKAGDRRLRAQGRGPEGQGLEGHLRPRRRHPENLRQCRKPGKGAARRLRGQQRIGLCAAHIQARKALIVAGPVRREFIWSPTRHRARSQCCAQPFAPPLNPRRGPGDPNARCRVSHEVPRCRANL